MKVEIIDNIGQVQQADIAVAVKGPLDIEGLAEQLKIGGDIQALIPSANNLIILFANGQIVKVFNVFDATAQTENTNIISFAGQIVNIGSVESAVSPVMLEQPSLANIAFSEFDTSKLQQVNETFSSEKTPYFFNNSDNLVSQLTFINTAQDILLQANPDFFTTTEDQFALGNLLANDIGNSTQLFPGTYTTELGATATLFTNGLFIYNPLASLQIQALAQGQTSIDRLTYTVQDSTGATAQANIFIRVIGVNDIAAIAGVISGSVIEDTTLIATGNLTVNDIDNGENFFQSGIINGSYGSITIDSAGAWTYLLDNNNPIVQALNQGSTLQDVIAVRSIDGTPQLITINISGIDEPSLSVNNFSVNENVGEILFTITKTGNSTVTATVNYTTNDGSATGSNDYTADNGTITFTAGQTQAYVTIAVTNDAIYEGTETFTLDLSGAANATISTATGTGTITNDDAAPTIVINDVTVNEEAGTMIFTVIKTGSTALTSTVDYTTTNGSATSANDYTAASGTLTFTAGQTQALITVTVSNDAVFEGSETFTMDLSNAVNSTISDNQGIATIIDNADLPTISVGDVAVSESAGALIFTIAKTGTTLQTTTVNYTTTDGSATSGNDFTASNGTITFTAGQTQAYVTIAITNDAIYEGTETFTLGLSSATNATISTATGTGTITNDDAAPTIAINDLTVSESAGLAIFTLSKSGATGVTTTVNYTTNDGSATGANDFAISSGTVTFTTGQTQAYVTVTLTNDAVYENSETFSVDLSGAINATISDNQGIATITNDDALPSFAINDVTANEEAGVMIFTVAKTGLTAFTSTVNYATANGTATSANDYIATSGTITLTADQTQALMTVSVSNDAVFEGTETFAVNLSVPVNATISDNQGISTIIDDTDKPAFSVNDVSVNEGTSTVIFTVTKTGTTLLASSVNYTTNDGTATSANDYVSSSGILSFTSGQTRALITISISNDAIFEGTETFTFDLSNATNAVISDNQGIGTIVDDTDRPTFAVNDVTVAENTGPVIFTITKTGTTLQTATVNYATANSTATSANDYVANSGTLTFTANQTQAFVTVVVSNDAVYEANESFVINLSAAVNATISDTQGIALITNDDALPVLTVNDVSANEEAGTLIFTVTKTGGTVFAGTVAYTTNDGSASSASDYATNSGILTFTASQTRALVTVTLSNDAVYEGDETFTIDLSSPVNVTIGDSQGVGTIVDNLDRPAFSINDVTQNENLNTMIFTITKTGTTLQTATVAYTTADGGATSTNDYVTASGVLTFTAAQTQALITVTISDDAVYEGNETFAINLSGAVNATISDSQGIGTINNEDAAPVLTINDVSVNEGTATVVFTVTNTGSTAVTTTVNYTTANGTALSTNDYVTKSGTLTFTAGQTQSFITVNVSNDAVYEGTETFVVNLSAAVNATIGDSQGVATINDDTDKPLFSVNDVSVNEGTSTVIFTVTKTGTTLQPATVNYTTTDGTATNLNDYVASSGTLTFTSGQDRKSVV